MANTHVCPAEHAGFLDNSLRRLLHNPNKILRSIIKKDMRVADIGCGPGFFTIPIAQLVGANGKVYAYDLQKEMLSKLERKIQGTDLEARVSLHQCEADKINFVDEVDCVLGFYMVHESADQISLIEEVFSALAEGGIFIIVEPPFHVSKKEFEKTCEVAINAGFIVEKGPFVLLGRSILCRK